MIITVRMPIAHLVEAFPHALLDHVLEVDDAQHRAACPSALPTTKAGAAAGGDARRRAGRIGGHGATLVAHPPATELAAPFAQLVAVDVDAGHPGLR